MGGQLGRASLAGPAKPYRPMMGITLRRRATIAQDDVGEKSAEAVKTALRFAAP
jgi:hypothetical protein